MCLWTKKTQKVINVFWLNAHKLLNGTPLCLVVACQSGAGLMCKRGWEVGGCCAAKKGCETFSCAALLCQEQKEQQKNTYIWHFVCKTCCSCYQTHPYQPETYHIWAMFYHERLQTKNSSQALTFQLQLVESIGCRWNTGQQLCVSCFTAVLLPWRDVKWKCRRICLFVFWPIVSAADAFLHFVSRPNIWVSAMEKTLWLLSPLSRTVFCDYQCQDVAGDGRR